MTREEREKAISRIKYLQKYADDNEYWWLRDFIETFNMAIEALEQEPCGKDINVPATDAISIQDVVKAVDKHTNDDGTLDDDITCILEDVPSVTPQPKTGYWHLLDECSNSGYYCSECLKKVVKEGWSKTVKKIKFCPNCGCRMMEVEE